MTARMDLTVYGVPAPQGSKRHVGRGVMVESSAKVKPWREAVKAAVGAETGGLHEPLDGAVSLLVTFYFPRPRSHYRTGKNAHLLRDAAPWHPSGKPDIDKLVRSTLDALTDCAVIRDDSRVVDLTAWKRWVDDVPHRDAPGAWISVQTLNSSAAASTPKPHDPAKGTHNG